jgi:hypothetical protein
MGQVGTFFFEGFPMAFLCVSQQGEFKHTIKIFSKIRPENLKTISKKGRHPRFFFSLGAPWMGAKNNTKLSVVFGLDSGVQVLSIADHSLIYLCKKRT